MVEGLAPPTRAVVYSHVSICRRLRIQYVFLHMCGVNQFWIIVFFAAVKPANNIFFCIELIQRPESSLRRHKLGLTDQSIRSNDDKTRFTCVNRLMTTGQRGRHLDAETPSALTELKSTNRRCNSVCRCPGVATEPRQHPDTLWKCGVRVTGRTEEPNTGMLRPRKQTSGTSCVEEGWIYGSMHPWDLSWQTSPRSWFETQTVW